MGKGKARLTHLDASGAARMVDVSGKPVMLRRAAARGRIRMKAETLRAVREGAVKKGDVLAAARIAAISAAKETARIIPLCHTLPLEMVKVDFAFPEETCVEVRVATAVTGRTGVEMDALTGAAVALLVIYDMAKAMDRSMVIEEVRLLKKTKGAPRA
ncbi:MAG: cyclic pyranopterin monophosphate synthase MoaC [Planctomycetota bacterium]